MGDYFKKYLKYKSKYISLRGGTDDTQSEKNVLLVSHNNRIKCLLKSIGIPIIKKLKIDNGPGYYKTHEDREIGFFNCAIIKLTIRKDYINVSLLYNGSRNDKDKNYYFVKEQSKDYDVNIEFTVFNVESKNVNNILKILNIDNLKDETWNFYIVRSGDVSTNILKVMNTDPVLNLNGIKQAEDASRIIQDINFDIAFVSDLKRSRETIGLMLINNKYYNKYDDNYNLMTNNNLNKINNIYVLPCSHELNYDNSKCNEAPLITLPKNIMNTDILKSVYNGENAERNRNIKINNDKIIISLLWDYYYANYKKEINDNFTKNNKRGSDSIFNKNKCMNTSMISNSLKIYYNEIKNQNM